MPRPLLRPDPPMAFGCMPFGDRADEAASAALFAAARVAGISQFDTAHLYAGGASERILGRLAQGERGLSLATKIGYRPGTDAAGLRAEFAESLRRLGTASLDLLYLHRDDPTVPMEARLEVLVDLQEQGLVRRIGLSNHAAWRVMQAQALLRGWGRRWMRSSRCIRWSSGRPRSSFCRWRGIRGWCPIPTRRWGRGC